MKRLRGNRHRKAHIQRWTIDQPTRPRTIVPDGDSQGICHASRLVRRQQGVPLPLDAPNTLGGNGCGGVRYRASRLRRRRWRLFSLSVTGRQ